MTHSLCYPPQGRTTRSLICCGRSTRACQLWLSPPQQHRECASISCTSSVWRRPSGECDVVLCGVLSWVVSVDILHQLGLTSPKLWVWCCVMSIEEWRRSSGEYWGLTAPEWWMWCGVLSWVVSIYIHHQLGLIAPKWLMWCVVLCIVVVINECCVVVNISLFNLLLYCFCLI